jgi:hypothetical protein
MAMDAKEWHLSTLNGMLYALKNLKELTIVTELWHYLPCYKTAQLQQNSLEFLDPHDLDKLCAREIEEVRNIRWLVEKVCGGMKAQYPDWQRPEINVRVQRRKEGIELVVKTVPKGTREDSEWLPPDWDIFWSSTDGRRGSCERGLT